MIKFLDLNSQYLSIKSEVDAAIASVLRIVPSSVGNTFHNLKKVSLIFIKQIIALVLEMEQMLSRLLLSHWIYQKAEKIIVPANSFISSAEAVTRTGYKVVFCDARPDDYTIDIVDLEKESPEIPWLSLASIFMDTPATWMRFGLSLSDTALG